MQSATKSYQFVVETGLYQWHILRYQPLLKTYICYVELLTLKLLSFSSLASQMFLASLYPISTLFSQLVL